MRVLVLGCGYVGLALARELVRQGHTVAGLRRSDGARAELEAAGITPLIADLAQPGSLERLEPAYDWVVNCVASSQGGADDYRQVYLEGMRRLLDWLRPAPPRGLVYTSSTGVYGQNDGSLVDETCPAEPETETGRILVQAEQTLLAAARAGAVPGIVLRLAGIYGPGRGYWLRQFLAGQATLEGDGSRFLNMIHRDDAAGAAIAALKAGRPGEVYNVVDHEPVRQVEVFQWLARRLGREMPPAVPEPPDARRRRGATNKRISNRKLVAELGYEFQYPTFREGYEAELARLQARPRD